jgi:hypothetical protein
MKARKKMRTIGCKRVLLWSRLPSSVCNIASCRRKGNQQSYAQEIRWPCVIVPKRSGVMSSPGTLPPHDHDFSAFAQTPGGRKKKKVDMCSSSRGDFSCRSWKRSRDTGWNLGEDGLWRNQADAPKHKDSKPPSSGDSRSCITWLHLE